MSIRQTQRTKTRQTIVDTAKQVFADQGIGASRTADIASAAGLSHGALFSHFPTRDDLIVAVVESFSGTFRASFDERLGHDLTVAAVLGAHLAQVEHEEVLYARLATEGPLLPQAARAAWLNVLTTLSLRLGEAIDHLPPEAPLRALPLALAFNTWIGLLHHHLAYRELFAPEGEFVKRRGPTLLAYMAGTWDLERMEA